MKKLAFPFHATVLAFLCFLWVRAISPTASGLTDNDFFWHLAYGQWIIEHREIPTVDFFSWTFAGQPYQLTQWLGEAIMGLAYKLWEFDGTRLLSVLLAAVTVGFAWAGARRFVHSSAALCLALMCNLVQLILPMRPQLFTFSLISVGAYLIVSYIETRRVRFLVAYPLLMTLWVNLHGGFVVGLALIGLAAAGLSLEALLSARFKASVRELLPVWGIVLASVAATLLNPYGYEAIQAVLTISSLRSASVISEWMPVNIATDLGWLYLIILVPYIAMMLISATRPRLTYGLIAGFFLLFGILANRQLPMCAAVMAPLIAALLARTPQYRTMLPNLANPSYPKCFAMITLALAVSIPPIVAHGEAKRETKVNFQYPVQAIEFLLEHALADRVLSDTGREASYMTYRGIPVFIDGRMDLYGDQFFFEWYFASRATPGWKKLIERHRPTALLLRHDMAIRQAALAGGKWKQVFEDDRYSVLVPSNHPLPSIEPREVHYLDKDGTLIRPYTP